MTVVYPWLYVAEPHSTARCTGQGGHSIPHPTLLRSSSPAALPAKGRALHQLLALPRSCPHPLFTNCYMLKTSFGHSQLLQADCPKVGGDATCAHVSSHNQSQCSHQYTAMVFLIAKQNKKGIHTHGWSQRRQRQHNCLSSKKSYCAYFHLSVTFYGTALQVEIGPLLLG